MLTQAYAAQRYTFAVRLRWRRGIQIGATALGLTLAAAPGYGQVRPTPETPPPDDNPSVRVGGTLFADYTQTLEPKTTDASGESVSPGAFNVARAYINVTGQLNHVLAFRITPDVVREIGTGSSVAGSMTLRLKYGYLQANLDDWLWRGTFVRAGMIPTPYVDFEETVYRYRFQGPTFADREGFMSSSDYGAAIRTLIPRGYGEIVAGVFNGETFTRADPNNQKAFELRGTVRPFPAADLPRGFRATGFYTADRAATDTDRHRAVGLLTFEHRFVNVAWSILDAADQPSATAPRIHSRGQSLWITPRLPLGELPVAPPAGVVRATLEGLFRFDRLEPDRNTERLKQRWIAGAAYWPRMRSSSIAAAFLLDYEHVTYDDFNPRRPTERRLALHLLATF
jgi:hypothetical protein